MEKRIVLCLLVLALPDEDILVDYRDYFSEEELAAFIPAFREEGTYCINESSVCCWCLDWQ